MTAKTVYGTRKWWNRQLANTRLNNYLVLGVLNVMLILLLWFLLFSIVPIINSQVASGTPLVIVTGVVVLFHWVIGMAALLAMVRFKIV